MRLIDADALQRHFEDMQRYDLCAANFMDHRGEPSTNWYCVEDAIENAPTVEAIPKEWLISRMAEAEKAVYYCKGNAKRNVDISRAIRTVLELWEDEKEAR